jgi:nucleoid-associated protein YgaU
MKPLIRKEIVCVVIIFLTAYILPGCATYIQPNTEPPPRFRKELDSLKYDRIIQEFTKYTVKKGDTIWRIAQTYGVSPDKIIEANYIKNASDIRPGQQLIIPISFTGTRKAP